MKTIYLLPLFASITLTGCSSQGSGTAVNGKPSGSLTPEQKIAKIQSDPKVPDGLKQIQIGSLQREAGVKPGTP